jgi:uncharacterized protein with PQ loop repeat
VDFQNLLGAWCFGLSLIFTIPQAVRVIRRDTVEGISVTTQLQGVAGSILWIVYGLVSGSPVVAAANVVTLVGIGVVVYKQVELNVITMRFAVGVELSVCVLAFATWGISESVLGAVTVFIGSTGIIPQAIRAARTSKLVGVSVMTFLIITTMTISWGTYGLLIGDVFVAAPNIIIGPCALFIAIRAIQSHRRYGSSTTAEAIPAR